MMAMRFVSLCIVLAALHCVAAAPVVPKTPVTNAVNAGMTLYVNPHSHLHTLPCGNTTTLACKFISLATNQVKNTAATVNLAAGIYPLHVNNSVSLSGSASVTFVGAGITSTILSGNATFLRKASVQDHWLRVEGTASATVQNLAIKDSFSPSSFQGGGIYVTGSASLTVTGCLLRSLQSYSGGAIYSDSTGPVTLSHSSFTNNTAFGGVVGGSGGAVYVRAASMVTIDNCTFSENLANQKSGSGRSLGGALGLDLVKAGVVSSCSFEYNTVASSIGANGGAIGVRGATLTITGSNFNTNNVSGVGGAGGAIAVVTDAATAPKVTITNNMFNDNYLLSQTQPQTVEEITVFATQPSYVTIGAGNDFKIQCGFLQVCQSCLSNATCGYNASVPANVAVCGINNEGYSRYGDCGFGYNVTITLAMTEATWTSTYKSKFAIVISQAAHTAQTDITVYGVRQVKPNALAVDFLLAVTEPSIQAFFAFAASKDASGLNSLAQNLLATTITADGNTVQIPQLSVFYVNDKTGIITTPCGTKATPCKWIGFAVAQMKSSTTAQIQLAAGTYPLHINNTISLTKTQFVSVIGQGNDNTIVSGNATLMQKNSQQAHFIRLADNSGANLQHLTVAESYQATSYQGGGIYATDASTLTVNYVVMHSLQSASGGAVYADTTGSVTLTNSLFLNNTALGQIIGGFGGAVYVRTSPALTINNCTFSENLANQRQSGHSSIGGALGIEIAAGTVSASTFTYNTVASANGANGGAVGLRGSSVTITGSMFNTNNVSGSGGLGGAIAVVSSASGPSTLTLGKSTFVDNYVDANTEAETVEQISVNVGGSSTLTDAGGNTFNIQCEYLADCGSCLSNTTCGYNATFAQSSTQGVCAVAGGQYTRNQDCVQFWSVSLLLQMSVTEFNNDFAGLFPTIISQVAHCAETDITQVKATASKSNTLVSFKMKLAPDAMTKFEAAATASDATNLNKLATDLKASKLTVNQKDFTIPGPPATPTPTPTPKGKPSFAAWKIVLICIAVAVFVGGIAAVIMLRMRNRYKGALEAQLSPMGQNAGGYVAMED